jgi:hypothetical protein
VITPPSKSLPDTVAQELKPPTPPAGAGAAGVPPVSNAGSLTNLPSPYITSEADAATYFAKGIGGKIASAAGGWLAQTALSSAPAALVIQVVAVDAVAGAWDLGYVPWILNQIGVVKSPTVKF